MDDKEWIASLSRISTAEEMLATIVDNQEYFGYDPYYSDLRKAMIGNAERVLGRDGGGQ